MQQANNVQSLIQKIKQHMSKVQTTQKIEQHKPMKKQKSKLAETGQNLKGFDAARPREC